MKNKKVLKISPTVQLLVAIGLFAVTALASNGRDVTTREADIFLFFYEWPGFLQPIFLMVTQLGSIHMLGLLLIIYLLKRHYHIVLRLLMTGLLAYLAAGFAKDIWGRVRPIEILTDVVSLDYVVRGPGFPSGHTALATALALTLIHYSPKKYHMILIVLMVMVGISRMYLGVHFPLDIVGGFAIGWASYALFRHIRLYDITFRDKQLKDVKSRSKKAASKSL